MSAPEKTQLLVFTSRWRQAYKEGSSLEQVNRGMEPVGVEGGVPKSCRSELGHTQ